MKVIVDTNVLVSGLSCPHSPSGEIVRMMSSSEIVACYDARIMAEYEEVLKRPKFRFDQEKVAALLDFVREQGQVCAGQPLPRHLPDRDDEAFLEVAIAGKATSLITGNTAHFPGTRPARVNVTTPRAFVELWRKRGPRGAR